MFSSKSFCDLHPCHILHLPLSVIVSMEDLGWNIRLLDASEMSDISSTYKFESFGADQVDRTSPTDLGKMVQCAGGQKFYGLFGTMRAVMNDMKWSENMSSINPDLVDHGLLGPRTPSFRPKVFLSGLFTGPKAFHRAQGLSIT